MQAFKGIDCLFLWLGPRPKLEHVLLQCSAVNDIDASALESLEAIASRLKDSDIALHFSEIKGPVMDKLNTTDFLQHLHGQVFLTNYQAIQALTPEMLIAHWTNHESNTVSL